MLIDDLHVLTRLAPALPLEQAAKVLAWVAEIRGAPAPIPSVGGNVMADPEPAAPALAEAAIKTKAPRPVVSAKNAADWSDADEAALCRMRAEGVRDQDIAEAFGRSISAVKNKAFKLGVKVADPKYQNLWTDKDKALANDLRDRGLTYAEIGKHLGRTGKAVMVFLSRHRRMAPPPAAPEVPPAVATSMPPKKEVPAPVIAPAVAPVVTNPPPAKAVDDQPLTVRQCALVDHMDRLADDFTAEDDLFLVEELAKGIPGGIIADQLGINIKTAGMRFRALQTQDIQSIKGILTIDGQRDLLIAARYRTGRHA